MQLLTFRCGALLATTRGGGRNSTNGRRDAPQRTAHVLALDSVYVRDGPQARSHFKQPRDAARGCRNSRSTHGWSPWLRRVSAKPPGFLGRNYGIRIPNAALVAHAIFGGIIGALYSLRKPLPRELQPALLVLLRPAMASTWARVNMRSLVQK